MAAWLAFNDRTNQTQLAVPAHQAPDWGHAPFLQTPLQPQNETVKLQFGPGDAFPIIGHIQGSGIPKKHTLSKLVQPCGDVMQ
jgi:hypothetical protein